MAYAGMATAMGQYLEIPIILRFLVTLLSFITQANLPVPFNSGFIALLEVGTSDEEFGRVVKKYAYNWWDKSREPEDLQLLHPEILDECLNVHEEQLLKSSSLQSSTYSCRNPPESGRFRSIPGIPWNGNFSSTAC